MSTLQVNTINAATSGQGVAVDVKNPRSFRNLIINGAMNVAQRGTSDTSASAFLLDRWKHSHGGHNEDPTYSQHALTSSDTGPWEKGFRNSFHIQNGNQTGSYITGDYIQCETRIEAQYLTQSGWEYNSTSSDITLSFWVKSSVAQAFPFTLQTHDGTSYRYSFTTGSLSANTWTKVTKTIPGNANLQINNDTEKGLTILFFPYLGTNWTGTTTENTWYSGGDYCNDMTSTWWTTNDATFEVTGVQLEVGSYATSFEHRTYADELRRCERYYQNSYLTGNVPGTSNSSNNAINLLSWADGNVQGFTFPRMRASPTVILRSQNATTVARLDSSGTDRVASAQNVNDHHVKYISVTSGSGNSWASVCYELNAEI